MSIKKGLSYVAFGFLFTLVNINLTLNGAKINVTPSFIGWILFFLAHDQLGEYTADQKYLKWAALVQVILTAAIWILEIAKPELEETLLETVSTAVSTVYMFILFGSLEKIAHDYGSSREDTVHMLRYINLGLNCAAFLVSVLAEAGVALSILAGIVLVLGIAAIPAAVFTLIVLFKLKNEIGRQAV